MVERSLIEHCLYKLNICRNEATFVLLARNQTGRRCPELVEGRSRHSKATEARLEHQDTAFVEPHEPIPLQGSCSPYLGWQDPNSVQKQKSLCVYRHVNIAFFVYLLFSCSTRTGPGAEMERNMKSSNFIFLVYRMLRAVEQEAGLDGLDARAKALLLLIADGDFEGSALTVGDLTRTGNMGTAPTVYSALNALESDGWIERRQDKDDARARRLCLTEDARKVFGRMSSQARRALRS